MACYTPITAYRGRTVNPSGKVAITFRREESNGQELELPCGRCIGCRLRRSAEWALRGVHEASLHDRNCFITLTYNNENLPYRGSLNKTHFQKFMKRLRRYSAEKIRFYHCGEYGPKLARPHYHAALFGFDFQDKYPWKQNDHGDWLYRSPLLEKCWPFGYSSVGELTFESVAYVARYILKKQLGPDAEEHYTRHCALTDQFYTLEPEYTTMSRKPGIGRDWLSDFVGDVYPHDFVVHKGRRLKPPRFYDNYYEVMDPDSFEQVKAQRKRNARRNAISDERRDDLHKIQRRKQRQITRSYEDGA